MSELRGFDAWLTRVPDDDEGPPCPHPLCPCPDCREREAAADDDTAFERWTARLLGND